jgi:Raf kinase inhibitor-like YbhB/YbcL family protein
MRKATTEIPVKKAIATCAVLLALALGAALAQDKGGKGDGNKGALRPTLTLTSPDIEDGGVIPDRFTQKAGPAAVSPKLEWTNNVATGVVTFVLLLHDPDAGRPQKRVEDHTYWMIFNIPGTARELAAGISADAKLADGAIQIKSSSGAVGFVGPGGGIAGRYHHYTFELFAVDTKLALGPDATRADVMKAMDGHVIVESVLVGRFHM